MPKERKFNIATSRYFSLFKISSQIQVSNSVSFFLPFRGLLFNFVAPASLLFSLEPWTIESLQPSHCCRLTGDFFLGFWKGTLGFLKRATSLAFTPLLPWHVSGLWGFLSKICRILRLLSEKWGIASFSYGISRNFVRLSIIPPLWLLAQSIAILGPFHKTHLQMYSVKILLPTLSLSPLEWGKQTNKQALIVSHILPESISYDKNIEVFVLKEDFWKYRFLKFFCFFDWFLPRSSKFYFVNKL